MQNIIAGLIVMLIGSWMALSPQSVWIVAESWKQKGGEMSGSFLKICRILGSVFLLTGIAVIIWG